MLKGKIINFEVLWDCEESAVDLYPHTFKKDILNAAKDGYNLIVGIMLNEGLLYCDNRRFLKVFDDLKNISEELKIEIKLVSSLGENFKNIDVPFEVLHYDYHARMIFNSYKNVNFDLNRKSDKFLFLGGVPTRANRIGLLSKFYDQQMLDHCEWSFFPPIYHEDKVWCRNHLRKYSDDQYERFINSCQRRFDDRYVDVNYLMHDSVQYHNDQWFEIIDKEFFKSPGYIDPQIFRNTCFSIISEGPNFWGEDYEFITIITWRTIRNCHPFIFAGPIEQYDYIKKLGFKTFEEYLLIKDYAYIDNEHQRLDAVVENAKHLLKNYSSIKDCLDKDVEYNYKNYMRIIEKQDRLLDHIEKDLIVDRKEINHLLDGVGFDHLVRKKDE
jgi:hypothetical protein